MGTVFNDSAGQQDETVNQTLPASLFLMLFNTWQSIFSALLFDPYVNPFTWETETAILQVRTLGTKPVRWCDNSELVGGFQMWVCAPQDPCLTPESTLFTDDVTQVVGWVWGKYNTCWVPVTNCPEPTLILAWSWCPMIPLKGLTDLQRPISSGSSVAQRKPWQGPLEAVKRDVWGCL